MELYSIKKQLEESESRIGSYVGEVNRQINNTWSPREILYMDAYYGWKRYKANLLIKPDRKSSLLSEERFLKEKLAGLPGMNCNQSVGEMMNDILYTIRDRIDDIKTFRNGIFEAAAPFVCHVSPQGGLQYLRASKNKENMYCNEAPDAVYGVTKYDELVLYIGRAIAESMHIFRDGSCIYKKNPVKEVTEGKVILKRPVYLYCTDIDWFEPVTDFYAENGSCKFCFGHEWVSRNEMIPRSMEIKIVSVPAEDLEKHRLYCYTDESIEKKLQSSDDENCSYDFDFLADLVRRDYIRRIII